MFSASKTAGPSGYNISRSVRLRSSASAYFNRTPASAGNRTTWTMSFWCKRGSLGAVNQHLFSATGYDVVRFSATYPDAIEWEPTNLAGYAYTSAVFRDPSAWYHLVFVWDSSNATAANRMRLYVNNVQQTINYTVGAPAQNTQSYWNAAVVSTIGAFFNATQFLDGYLTEINFIDGQALTPSSFGSTNATTGVWQPAKYTGTYGTNGFYLNFSDNSAATAAAIGKDYSGNGNNWTPNNISVTAGVTYDSMIDVPTPYADGGNGRGNYCVLNPLLPNGNAPSGGNLNWSITNSTQAARGTLAIPNSGKWYWEVTSTALGGGDEFVGIMRMADAYSTSDATGGTGGSYVYRSSTGAKLNNGSSSAYGASWTANDVIGVAFDADAGTLTFYKNNSSQGVAYSSLTDIYTPLLGITTASTNSFAFNAGQRPFSYTPPTGFKALNTQNLPTPTISNGANYMAATLYNGTGSSQSITNTVGSTSFKPDFFWSKSRSAANAHILIDSVRGATTFLSSNNTDADTTTTNGTLSSFNSNGVTLQADTNGYANYSGRTYVGWQWQAGQGSTSSNTNGSITSTVSVNATAGFSVVTYTGNGTNPGATIGHGLGVAPKLIITKSRSGTGEWPSYHASVGVTNTLYLNATYASSTYINRFSAVSSTTFTTGSNGGELNTNGVTYVAYCWSEIAGFSKFGSYTGNGSADGAFVYTGHRPRWLMVKRTDTTGDWWVWDSARNTFNVMTYYLAPNRSDAEFTANTIDFLSNGFKFRDSSSGWNASGGTYIFASFAENPFANALAR